ncbi:MAG: transposase [Deltaproteobacteria bacterium]|nr:transposase [Deltaproteobacteria bacterium]
MTSIVLHKDKKTGAYYAYESTCKRDPITKKPKSTQKYLGKWDPETKTVIPTNRKKSSKKSNGNKPLKVKINDNEIIKPIKDELIDNRESLVTTKIVGPHLVIQMILETLNMIPLLKATFPIDYKFIISIASYLLIQGQELSKIETWSLQNIHFYDEYISGPRISDFLEEINPSSMQSFLLLWLKSLNEEEFLYYNITSVSSCCKSNNYVKRGHNHDTEDLEKINIAILIGQNTQLPAHYRVLRGKITDVSSIERTFKYLDLLSIKNPTYILDRCFYSEKNVTLLLDKSFSFLMSLPSSINWIETIIDIYYDNMLSPDNYHQIIDGESISAIKHVMAFAKTDKSVYLHIFYNPSNKNSEFQEFIDNVTKLKEIIESNNKSDKYLMVNYEKYLLVIKTAKSGIKVEYNHQKIEKYKQRYSGFFCLLSPNIKDPIEALKIYRSRDKAEKYFDDLKNSLDSKRLMVNTASRMEGRIFIQFISLIFKTQLRKMLDECNTAIKHLSTNDVLDSLKILSITSKTGKHTKLYSEADKRTILILDFFGIEWPGHDWPGH